MRLNTPNVFSTTKKRGDGNSSLVLLVIFAALTVILTFVCSLISPFPSTVAVQAVSLTRATQSSDGQGPIIDHRLVEMAKLPDADAGRLLKNIILKHNESDVIEEAEKGEERKVKKTSKVSETAEQSGSYVREQEGAFEAADKPAKESTKKDGKGWLGWIFGGGDGKDKTEQSDDKEATPKRSTVTAQTREEDASPERGDAGGDEDASPELGDDTTKEQHEKDVVENNIQQTNDNIELVKIRLNGEVKQGIDNIIKKVDEEINKLKQSFNNELSNITSGLVKAIPTGGQYQVLVSREESPSERKEEIPRETRQSRDTGNSDKRRIDSHKGQDGGDGLGQSEALSALLKQPREK
eukprot:GHVN01005557.1.p1 GENE.GHVN01005557.1~~GHVN01005557.1.p1  ORF type:complete len:353 (-),score=107.01 GHVN01005557.1:595-1653(-)